LGIALPVHGGDGLDELKFLWLEPSKIGLRKPPLIEQTPKYADEHRVPEIVLAVALIPPFEQELLNPPDLIWLIRVLKHDLNLPPDRSAFASESAVECSTSDLFLTVRPVKIEETAITERHFLPPSQTRGFAMPNVAVDLPV
jgi:hypothetical protein